MASIPAPQPLAVLKVFLVSLVFLVCLVLSVFKVGVGAGGLGDGLLSRWVLASWVRFPLPAVCLAGFLGFPGFIGFPASLCFRGGSGSGRFRRKPMGSPLVGAIPAPRPLLSWFSRFSRFSRISWFSWFPLFSGRGRWRAVKATAC